MKIKLLDINTTHIDYALSCLMECMQKKAEKYGFNYPYFTPGGSYGQQWWQLDSSLALSGYKWIDRDFCETSLKNFIESQKHDGRICLWGADLLPKSVAGNNFPKQSENVSSLPKVFDVVYHILKGSVNKELKEKAYNMLFKYLNWWFENRLDKETGLITAVFEETFIPYLGYAGEYAPVDTNTEVYVGCVYTEKFAKELGKQDDVKLIKKRKDELKESINKYLWSEEKGAYYPYDIINKQQIDCLMASTFYPLRMKIASHDKKEKLISLLKNQEEFNFDTIPVTSVSKKDKEFTITEGEYIGNKSWSGNVWTLINEMIIRGLKDYGEYELASELALKTLRIFKNNCAEFINPFDGKGHGVLKYAWTASQYIELAVEVIFGVSYDAENDSLDISPALTEEMKKENLYLELDINKNRILELTIENGKISYKFEQKE